MLAEKVPLFKDCWRGGGYRGVREEHEAESHARAGRWSREKASPRLRLVIAFARLIITKRNDTFSTSYSNINFCQFEQFSCCFSFDIIYHICVTFCCESHLSL